MESLAEVGNTSVSTPAAIFLFKGARVRSETIFGN